MTIVHFIRCKEETIIDLFTLYKSNELILNINEKVNIVISQKLYIRRIIFHTQLNSKI